MLCLVAQLCPLFVTPWAVHPVRLLCPWDSPGKNTRVGCHFLLQGIFPTQELNPGLLHCRMILYYSAMDFPHKGSPSLLDCPIHGHITVHNILYDCFVSLQYQLLFLLFNSYLGPLFFLVSLAKSLSIFKSFLKTSSWSHWSFLLFLWSLFYFLSDLYYFIFLLTLDFVCSSFSNSFRQ